MQSLNTIVQKHFPEEKILSEFKAKAHITFELTSLGSITLLGKRGLTADEYVYSQKAVPVIETDKRYYVDRRGFPKDQWFKFPRVLYFVVFFSIIVIFNIYIIASLPLGIMIFAILAYAFFGYFLLNYYTSLAHIYVIEKSWIIKQDYKDDKTSIEGTIPRGITTLTPAGFSILYFITDRRGLSFDDKFFSLGKSFGNMWQTTLTGNFLFTFSK